MQNRYFPFHALGFHCNPFRAVTDEEWAEIAIIPQAVVVAFANVPHLQILGPSGHGKTSILLGLVAQLTQEGKRVAYEYLPEGQRRFQTQLSGLDALLLDEAQRLSVRERNRLLAQADPGTRLLLGGHADFRPLFAQRALPFVSIDLSHIISPTHLQRVLERRLLYFALPGVQQVIFAPDAICYLHETFGGNLRSLHAFLYEVFQALRQPGVISAEQLQAATAFISSGAGP